MKKDINNIEPRFLEEDDRIVAYLKGEMSAKEEQQFFQELESNPELKEKAIVTARLIKGLKEVGEEQDKDAKGAFLASSEHGIETVTKQVIRQRARTIPIRKVSTWIAVAASVVCIVWLGIDYTDYKHTTGLGEEYGRVNIFSSKGSIEDDIFVRGADNSSKAPMNLEKLFTSVKNGESLKNTIHELSLCWELSIMETVNDYSDYSADIGWNLAIAYLKDNNKEEAKKILEKMETLADIDPIMAKKVRELREKL